MQRWGAYRKRRGSLHWGMRIESSNAMLASLFANSKRNPKKQRQPFSIYDFMPHENDPAEEGELTLSMLEASTRRH